MGFFDSIKKTLGGSKQPDITAEIKSPSQVLREAGIETSGIKFGFSGDSVVTVKGEIAAESDRQGILDALAASEHIKEVVDELTMAAPAPEIQAQAETSAEAQAEPAPEPEAEGGRRYTVQPGDSLSKISREMYGDGTKYMKIFDANKSLLDNPDRIFPGQELVIPDLED